MGNNQATADLQRPSADDPMCLGAGMFVDVFSLFAHSDYCSRVIF